MTQPEREQRVSAAFVALADTLVDDYDIIDLLDQLVGHCVALLAADAAGIMLADPREQLRPVAASSEDAETMELLQLQSDEGPCLDGLPTGAGPDRPICRRRRIGGRGSLPRSPGVVRSPRCTRSRCGCAGRPSAR